jgi:outer membrane protein TolC
MAKMLRLQRPFFIRLAGSVTLLFPLCETARADGVLPESAAPALIALEQSAPAAQSATIPAPATAPSYTLSQCIGIALDQQPTITAQRASLAAAEAGRRGLQDIRVPTFLARDLPIRRQQAALGVGIAAATLEQAERETTYAVTRLYYTVIFAREQKKVTDNVVANIKTTHDLAEVRVKSEEGVQRALAALREAMGLSCETPLNVADTTLPYPKVTVNREEILALAGARRAELVQAQSASEITCLEIKAQGVKHGYKVETFAIGSDIHSRSIPQGSSDGEYRPGAIGLEMPDLLAGPKCDRQQRARDLYARSVAVVDKARGLILLEAEDAFLKWQEASRKVANYQEVATKGRKLADDTRNDYTASARIKPEDVLTNEILASQAQASLNEARHQLILALAALERITGGGFCANLAAQP